MDTRRYNYQEELTEARESGNYERLADWLDRYDPSSWNGESYDLGDGSRLYPIYDDESDIIGWEER